MNTTTKTAELIRQRIEAMPIGEPFIPTAFLECGTRASVDQTLSRLVKAGSIARVTRGVFVRPEVSRFVGKVGPSPLKVAEWFRVLEGLFPGDPSAARLSAQAGPGGSTRRTRACGDVVPRQDGSNAGSRREDSTQAGIERVRGAEVSHQLNARVDERRHLPERADGRSCLSPSCT